MFVSVFAPFARDSHGFLLAACILLTCCSTAVFADEDCQGPSSDCVAVGGWNFSVSLGAGVRTNPVAHESNIPLVVIPQISYYGKHFFLDNLDGGITFYDSDVATVSLVASPGYDRVFFYHTDPQNIFVTGLSSASTLGSPGYTMVPHTNANGEVVQLPAVKFPARSRQITYLAGPEWTFKVAGISGQLDVLHEITGHNHGDEVRGALGIPLTHRFGTWAVNAGFTWKSAAIVNYYYGAPDIYEGGAAFDPFVKLGFAHPLKGKWSLTAFVEAEHLSNAIVDSPIVNARWVKTTYAGVTYRF